MDRLYCFASEGISVVDVREPKVLQPIKTESEERFQWADGLISNDQGLIFINERRKNQVFVVNTNTNEVAAILSVGPNPVHIYITPDGKGVWTHSDEEGSLYPIDVASIQVIGKVNAAATGTGHGKLLMHSDLGSKGYATNAADNFVHIVDINNKKVTGKIDTIGPSHGKAYSTLSKHAYIAGQGGLSVIDTQTDSFLKHIAGGGLVFGSPDGKLFLSAKRKEGELLVIDALRDEVSNVLPSPGGTDQIFFNEKNGRMYAYTINVDASDVSIIDLNAKREVKRIPVGDRFVPPNAPPHSADHRSGCMSDDYLFVPSSLEKKVEFIDTEKRELSHSLDAGMAVQQTFYIGAGVHHHQH
ncbi:MAG: YncE family protein [Nitrososphaerales archaeon]